MSDNIYVDMPHGFNWKNKRPTPPVKQASQMNTYRYVFASKCPSDDETIIYGLEVRSKEMIRVEAIKDACAEWPTGFQEAIASDLRDVLGAAVSLRAQHQGVEILTELDAPARATTHGAPHD